MKSFLLVMALAVGAWGQHIMDCSNGLECPQGEICHCFIPNDVPAIRVTKVLNTLYGISVALGMWSFPVPPPCEGDWVPLKNTMECVIKRWTCVDKSRFLMTSEDGKRHCLRLGD